jgi:hypothetical protein
VAVPKTPKITWSAAFANTLLFPGPIDAPVPRTVVVGAVAESRSGVRDHWLTRTDYPLDIVVRFIPRDDDGSVNGYTASNGWQDFLAWAQKQNPLRYFPDNGTGTYYTCYLLEHDVVRDEGGARYRITLKMRADAKVTHY